MNNKLNSNIIGAKIRKVREIKNLTQEYVAGELNVSSKSFANWESGHVKLTIDKINDVSKVLEIDPIDLIGFDENVFFDNCKNGIFGYINTNNTVHNISDNERKLYEDLISSLRDQIEILKNK